jgi:hypothetical protein
MQRLMYEMAEFDGNGTYFCRIHGYGTPAIRQVAGLPE